MAPKKYDPKVNRHVFSQGDVVIEKGPKRVDLKVTPQLFTSGKIAQHYRMGGLDCYSNPIVNGQMATFVDWKRAYADWEWKVYKKDENGVMQWVQAFEDLEKAVAKAKTL